MTRSRASPRLLLTGTLILLASEVVVAENIDPVNKYAWSENLGWINARPGGPAGPGVQVSDTALTGYMWSENAGWISLTCSNDSTCGTSIYGVTNDGCGTLAGYAWSENAGWINFAPTTCGGDPTCGVNINPSTGIFSGRAWAENSGWITFSSTGSNPYRVATGWRRAVPAGQPSLSEGKSGVSDALLTWTGLSGATAYDAVYGDINVLRSSSGNFQLATLGHVVCGAPSLSSTQSGNPSSGNGYWFLVRGRNCGGVGTYGGGSRDAGINTSGNGCP